jgi:V/A-type H+-transporting ATPase subunit D
LEYILIPNLEETIKYITMKLSELERSNLSRLMRVKEIVRAH